MHKAHQHGVKIYISEDIYCTILLWVANFPDLTKPKQASINAFYVMQCPVLRFSEQDFPAHIAPA